jgi:hypothetical protein
VYKQQQILKYKSIMHYQKMTVNLRIMALLSLHLKITIKLILQNTGTDTTHTYFVNAAKTIGLNVDEDKEECDKAKSFQSQCPIHEFLMVDMVLLLLFHMYSCLELHITKYQQFNST